MALAKQPVPVLFTGGIDTKSAEQTVLPGSFLALENAVRRKTGRIDKRYGYRVIGNTISGDGVLAAGRKLDRFIDEMLLFDGAKAYGYAPSADKWISRGTVANAAVSVANIVRNSGVQAQPDMAYNSGLSGFVYEDSTGGVRAAVYDEADGSLVLPDTLLSVTGRRPKAIAIQNYIYFLYQESAQLTWCRVNTVNPSVISAPTAVIGINDMANAPWDIDVMDASQSVFSYNTTTPNIKIAYLLFSGILGTSSNGGYANTKTIADVGRQALTVLTDAPRSRFFVSWVDSSVGVAPVRIFGSDKFMNTSSTATTGMTSNSAAVDTLIHNLGLVIDSTNQLLCFSDFEYSSGLPTGGIPQVRYVVYTWVLGTFTLITAVTSFKYTVGLAAKPFLSGTEVYLPLVQESEQQTTYFFVRFSDKKVVGQALQGTSGGFSRDTAGAFKSSLPRTVSIDTNHFAISLTKVGQFTTLNGHISTESQGIVRVALNLETESFRGATLGSNYHLAGGILRMYDGQSFTEHGFLLYPEYVVGTPSTAAGSITPGMNYFISAMYEWTDAQGQVHRSAPSLPIEVTMGGADNTITVQVRGLAMTDKTGDRANARIVIYRGEASQATPLFRDEVGVNDPTGQFVTIVLTKSDAALSTGELLYTTGDVLENIAAPGSTIDTVHKNRLWLAGLEDGNQLAYSKEYVNGEAVAFNDAQRIQVDPSGGNVTGLASLDDKLVIFKHDRLFALVGDGPVSTGALNDYQQPQFITADVGCVNQESIVLSPNGLMFKSDKGIYLLDRALGHKYIGAPVEAYNGSTITSAQLLESVNEIRFTTDDNICLVYNYFFDQWSVFFNYTSASAIAMNNTFYHLKSDGTTHIETAGLFNDNGARIPLAIETSWLALSGLQGYQRLYRYAFLGDYLSSHYTVVKLAYDYEASYKETVYFNVDSGLDVSYYGSDATYGESSVYGGPSGSSVYQFSSKPRQQKCESVKFRIEDMDTITDSGGASFNLVGLTLEVGAKRTIDKLSSGKRIGSL